MRLQAIVRALSASLLLMLNAADASFRVVTPVRANSTDIAYKLALFGQPQFGTNLIAPLVLAPQSNRDGCKPFEQRAMEEALKQGGIHNNNDEEEDGITDEFVLMIERGTCHFVEKVRHAQQTGAVGVVFYDTDTESHTLPVMADDGTGSDVQIPSLIIHYNDALDLMKTMNQTKTVVLMSWQVPHPDNRVEFSLWFSSRSSPALQHFLTQFRPIVTALGDAVKFTPHYEVHAGHAWNCDGAANACPKLCLYDNRYCTYDPEDDTTKGLDGSDVLAENVRQLCIQAYAEQTDNTTLWWDYVTRFNTMCSPANATSVAFNQACSHTVQQAVGVPTATIESCVQEQGPSLLERQLADEHTYHVVSYPELTVNDVRLYGSLQCSDSPSDSPVSLQTCAPLQMICAGFEEGTAPPPCTETYWAVKAAVSTSTSTYCHPPLERDECGLCALRSATASWSQACKGCDGVVHSNKTVDDCGVCGGNGSFDRCGLCLPMEDETRDTSCQDCKGVVHGRAKVDMCGVCGGHGSFDACGLCLDALDPRRQNFGPCHVVDDPDAVRAKMVIQGLELRQFTHTMLTNFQEAVAYLTNVDPNVVLVKSVDQVHDTPNRGSAVVVFFFVACEDDSCRDHVVHTLNEPSAALTVAMKLKNKEGVETLTQSIESVAFHLIDTNEVDPTNESRLWLVGVAVGCVMTLTIGFVGVKVREERVRRDFQQLFARYTPLTTMDYQDQYEYEYGGHIARPGQAGVGAGAW